MFLQVQLYYTVDPLPNRCEIVIKRSVVVGAHGP